MTKFECHESRVRLFLLVLFIGILSIGAGAQTNLIVDEYLKIRPLVSTRKDVERTLGKKDDDRIMVKYLTDNWVVVITYSNGQCSDHVSWAFPKDAVDEVFFVPLERAKLLP